VASFIWVIYKIKNEKHVSDEHKKGKKKD